MKRLAMLIGVLCIVFSGLIGTSGSAGADPPGSCYPQGFEHHQWDLVFQGYSSSNPPTPKVRWEVVPFEWNDDCHGVDPALPVGYKHFVASGWEWCGLEQVTQQFFRDGHDSPYFRWKFSGVARFRQVGTNCGTQANNITVIATWDVNANDGGTWGQCYYYLLNSPVCVTGSGPV